MMSSVQPRPGPGPAIYFDGLPARGATFRSRPRMAGCASSASMAPLDEWPYAELRRLSAPDDILRLGRAGQQLLGRLEIRNHALVAEIEERAASLDASGSAERRIRLKVVGWSLAAIISLVGRRDRRAGALDPDRALRPAVGRTRLGDAVDRQIREAIDTKHLGPAFECGTAAREAPAAPRSTSLLASSKPPPRCRFPHVSAVRRPGLNAFALPGGHVYVFEGLVDRAERPTSSPASSRTNSAMSRIATARARCCSRPACRSCSACCSATSSAAARSSSRRRRCCGRPIRARSRRRPISMA